MLYNIDKDNIEEIKELHFSSEKELQKLFEKNIKTLINLEFIETEFLVSNFRIDTLAFDKEANAFVIIEYKNNKNISVIDQGYTYLSTMLNHKADFVLKYTNKFNVIKEINDFDWSQSRVIFVNTNFTIYQMNCINFKDLPIELWKIKRFNNNTIIFEQIKPINSNESIKSIEPTFNEDKGKAKETKTYIEDDLTKGVNNSILDIYNDLKEYILSLNNEIELKPRKIYIGFNRGRKSIISIKLQNNSIILWINKDPKSINDPQKIIRDVTNIGHHGNGNSEIKIENKNNIGYIKDILRAYIEEI